jgi:hypothetical protein
MQAPIGIRPAREEDAPFILGSWINSYRDGSPDAKRIPSWFYFAHHRPLLQAILARPTVIPLVAHDPEEDSVIYGYLVAERGLADRDVVHYVYVKEPWQRLKICTRLLEAAEINPRHIYYTHHTRNLMDDNRGSPTYGKMRWRGTDTLLKKWPAATWVRDPSDPGGTRSMWVDGNIYLPYLSYMKFILPERKQR